MKLIAFSLLYMLAESGILLSVCLIYLTISLGLKLLKNKRPKAANFQYGQEIAHSRGLMSYI